MNEPEMTTSPSVDRTARLIAILALVLVLLLVGALWYLLDDADRMVQEREAMGRRVALVEEENAQLRRQASALTRRIDDDDALDRSLREELLGVSERAALLEQAIKRVSENRMDSVAELRLNQAELLLSAGIERLRLFDDAEAAMAALRLADAELARLEDPRYAGVRQTLAQELAALEAVPHKADTAALVMLAELRARLPKLALRNKEATRPSNSAQAPGRIESLLRGLVRVRHLGPRQSGLLGPLSADTLRAIIALDLLHAEEALRQRQSERFQTLVGEARDVLTAGFDLDNELGRELRLKLAELAAYRPATQPELGAALNQLVNLRHTREVARGVEQ